MSKIWWRLLKQDQGTLLHVGIVNIYFVYEITDNFNVSSYPTLENCLLGAVKLTKSAYIEKYGYSGYGIIFDRHGRFSFPGTGLGWNVIIFGVDMGSSIRVDNRKKRYFNSWERSNAGLEHILSAGNLYSINFTERKQNILLDPAL